MYKYIFKSDIYPTSIVIVMGVFSYVGNICLHLLK